MQIGIGLFLRTQRAGGISPDAGVAALFANGEQGAWYDAADMSTQYRDGSGTPVTTSGQSSALILDKRLGLARGAELIPNPDLTSSTNWNVTGSDATHTVVFGPTGARYRSDTTSPTLSITATGFVAQPEAAYEVTIVCSEWVSGSVKVSETASGIMVINGVGTFKAILRQGSASITRHSTNVDLTIKSYSVKRVAGNHLWQATPASRPVLQQDASRWYWQFDGTDDSMVSAAMDLTTSASLTVCAGFRKESDVNIAILAEFSSNLNTNTGAWYIATPIEAAKPGLAFVGKGTEAQYNDVAGYPSPTLAVLTGQMDIAAPNLNMRINGVQSSNTTSSMGTGTLGNYPLYLGTRGGAAGQNFKGRFYGLVVRSANSTAPEVTTLETYMNSKTGEF